MRLLILRPEPGNTATAQAARAIGLDPVCVPLFEAVSIDWTPPDPDRFDAIAMTSATAARCAGRALRRYARVPLYAVGPATAAAGRDAGFTDIVAGPRDGAMLAALLTGRVLHLTGTDHRPLPYHDVTAVPVYTMRERAIPTHDAAALDAATHAMVHSPRAGTRFARLSTGRDATVIAISQAAAQACGAGWSAVHVAREPRDDAMLALARSLCEAGTDAKAEQR